MSLYSYLHPLTQNDRIRRGNNTYGKGAYFILLLFYPTPVVTRSSEGTRPEPTSSMVTRSGAREGREMSVAPEVVREPEVEIRPEPEIDTCEGSLGATRSYQTDTALIVTSQK